MLSSPAYVVRRLLAAGLLSAKEIVDGELTVRDVSRSNAVYVITGSQHDLVVKQGLGERPADQGSGERERALYRAVAAVPSVRSRAPLPELVAELDDLLVVAHVESSDSMWYHGREFEAAYAERLGCALRIWHSVAGDLANAGFLTHELPGLAPWVLGSLGPSAPAFLSEHDDMRLVAQHLRSNSSLCAGLEGLGKSWRRTTLIHGDIRWDNAMLTAEFEVGPARVVLVDWEFVDLGDPAWDLACAVAEAIAVTVLDLTSDRLAGATGETADMYAPELARLVAPYVIGLRTGYLAHQPSQAVLDDLRMAGGYVPARLIQMAFQHAAWDAERRLVSGQLLGAAAAALFASPAPLVNLLAPR